MTDQIIFETDDFASNPEARCPCLLLLDISGSMSGQAMSELNSGLQAFKEELMSDALAQKRVEVGIVTFGPVNVEQSFTTAANFYPPTLSAQGATPMGEAIMQAMTMLDARKAEYRANGISYYRPWVFLITDGSPTDAWEAAAARVSQAEETKSVAFFAVGVKGADMETLKLISSARAPLQLDGLKFRELFRWLSSSLRSVSRSTPNTEVPLAPPTGWASV